jgi:hypothetical protein
VESPRPLPHWVTRPTESDDQESREIYALAGLALYMAQVLEYGLSHCLVLLDITRVIEAKQRFGDYEQYEKYLDTLEEGNFKRTLGALVEPINSTGVPIPEGLKDNLVECLTIGNRLAHRFFREHATDFFRPEGRTVMAQELVQMRALFEATDQQLEPIVVSLQAALGVSEEAENEFVAMMEEGVSESEIRSYLREKHKHKGVRAKRGET